MDGRISQKIRYLCKIHIIFTNQLFGKVNLHTGKEFDNSALIFFTEKLLKLRTSNHIVLGDIFNCQRLPHMFSEIVDDIPAGFRACLTGIINPCGSRIMCDSVSADHMDQKFFEIQRQKFLRTKRDGTFFDHFFKIWIIQGRSKTVSCFRNNASQNTSFGIGKFEYFIFKKFHTWGIARKRDYNDIWCSSAICFQSMKFIWTMKDDLTACESIGTIVCDNFGSTFIYTLKFPEIMTFTIEMKIISVFVVMNCINI